MSETPPTERYPMSFKITEEINKRFTYHPPKNSQPERYVAVREKTGDVPEPPVEPPPA